jgi:hypothetical protein
MGELLHKGDSLGVFGLLGSSRVLNLNLLKLSIRRVEASMVYFKAFYVVVMTFCCSFVVFRARKVDMCRALAIGCLAASADTAFVEGILRLC